MSGSQVHCKCSNILETVHDIESLFLHATLWYMAHQLAAIPMTLRDIQGHLSMQAFQIWCFAQICSSWQDFNWHNASRGFSAIAELLVWKGYQNSFRGMRPATHRRKIYAGIIARFRNTSICYVCRWMELNEVFFKVRSGHKMSPRPFLTSSSSPVRSDCQSVGCY